jgi:hypothetical protein
MEDKTEKTIHRDTAFIDTSGGQIKYKGKLSSYCSWMPNSKEIVYSEYSYPYQDTTFTYKWDISAFMITKIVFNKGNNNKRMMYNCLPNPFSKRIGISYELDKKSRINIAIYSANGAIVRNVLNGIKEKGKYNYIWDGCNDYGLPLSSGYYYLKINEESKVLCKKLIKL